MSKKRIIEHDTDLTLRSDDYILKDSATNDTKKITPEAFVEGALDNYLAEYVSGLDSASTSSDSDIFYTVVDGTQKKVSKSTILSADRTARATAEGTIVANFASPYSTTTSYAVGDYCIKDLVLYKCISPTSGTWDSTKWDAVTVAELLDSIDLSAEAISYDNTSSGLEAENVQEAIGETITKLSAVGSASGDIATFTDGSALPMPSLKVAIEPQQDLHGYDAPWVGGSGKNKYSILIGADAWNGNSSGTATNDNGTLVVSTTSADNSGVYSNLSAIIYTLSGQYSEEVTYSFDIKSDVAGKVFVGYTDVGRKEVSVTTSWQRVTITATAIGSNKAFVIYNKSGSARSIQIKNFMFETGSTVHDYEPYSNICPISGWDVANVGVSGVNVWDEEWEVGNINDGSGEDLPQDNVIRTKGYIRVMSGNSYYIKCPTTGISRLFLYAKDKSFITYVPIDNITNNIYTIPNNCEYIRFRALAAYGTTYNNDISINYPSTDTSYHAYNGSTYTIDLDGTRYGGTLDVVSGVLTVGRAIVTFDGSSDETISEYSASSYRYRLWISEYRAVAESVLDTKLICSKLKTYTKNNLASDSSILYGLSPSDVSSAYIIVKANGITNLADFKTWLSQNELQVVYPLVTPLTIQLTPTQVKSLLGANNIFADTGNILEAKYVRDLTSTINYILEQLEG